MYRTRPNGHQPASVQVPCPQFWSGAQIEDGMIVPSMETICQRVVCSVKLAGLWVASKRRRYGQRKLPEALTCRLMRGEATGRPVPGRSVPHLRQYSESLRRTLQHFWPFFSPFFIEPSQATGS